MNKKERLPEDTNELKEYLTTQVSRRQALSTAGKAAAGIVGLAIIGGGAYAMTQSGGAAPATVTQTATTTVTAEAAAAAKAAVKNPDTIVVGTRAAIGNFDTVTPGYRWASNLAYTAYNRLFYYEPGTDELKGSLVTDWTPNSDASSYTFKIREGVKFHSGNTLTAHDVKYSIDRALAIPGGMAANIIAVAKGSTITTNGDYEVTMDLPGSRANLLFPLAHVGASIVDSKLLDEHGGWTAGEYNEWLSENQHDIGSGPYQFKSFDAAKEELHLERFEDYWDIGSVNGPKNVLWRRIKDPVTQIQMIKNGDIDFIPLFDPTQAVNLAGLPTVNVVKHEAHPRGVMMGVNMTGKFKELADPRVRKALAYAIPYKSIINAARGSWGKRTVYYLVPAMPGYVADNPYDTDLEKAKELLAEAGYPNGFKTTLWWSSVRTVDRLASLLIQESFARAGIELELKGVQDPVMWAEVFKGDVPLNLGTASVQTADSVGLVYNWFHSKAITNKTNFAFYENSQVDQWIDTAMGSTDMGEIDTNVRNVVLQALEDVPYIPLYQRLEALPFSSAIDPGPIGFEYVFWYPVWRWTKG